MVDLMLAFPCLLRQMDLSAGVVDLPKEVQPRLLSRVCARSASGNQPSQHAAGHAHLWWRPWLGHACRGADEEFAVAFGPNMEVPPKHGHFSQVSKRSS